MGEILHTIAINAKRKHVYVGKLFEQKFLVNKENSDNFFPNSTYNKIAYFFPTNE